MVELAQSGASGMVMTTYLWRLPVLIRGVRCVRRGEIGTPTSQGRTWTGGQVSRMGLYRHSRSHACCVGQRERIRVRRRG